MQYNNQEPRRTYTMTNMTLDTTFERDIANMQNEKNPFHTRQRGQLFSTSSTQKQLT